MSFFSILIFILGIFMLYFFKKSYLFMIISLELLLLSIIYFLLSFLSLYSDNINVFFFILYILIIAAIESVLGLSLLILYYRITNTIIVSNTID